jgi:hypothetical protein
MAWTKDSSDAARTKPNGMCGSRLSGPKQSLTDLDSFLLSTNGILVTEFAKYTLVERRRMD